MPESYSNFPKLRHSLVLDGVVRLVWPRQFPMLSGEHTLTERNDDCQNPQPGVFPANFDVRGCSNNDQVCGFCILRELAPTLSLPIYQVV